MLALTGPGVAIACEGAANELEDETTHEKNIPFSPKEKKDELWVDDHTFGAPVTVKATALDIIRGNEWKLERECAKGAYLAGESCNPLFLIECLKATEPLEAELLIEIGAAVFQTFLISGTCLA
jgi:hypothetical protein